MKSWGTLQHEAPGHMQGRRWLILATDMVNVMCAAAQGLWQLFKPVSSEGNAKHQQGASPGAGGKCMSPDSVPVHPLPGRGRSHQEGHAFGVRT